MRPKSKSNGASHLRLSVAALSGNTSPCRHILRRRRQPCDSHVVRTFRTSRATPSVRVKAWLEDVVLLPEDVGFAVVGELIRFWQRDGLLDLRVRWPPNDHPRR